jgi:glycosyltransferase involved in cell wall biosynthesis
MRVAVVTEVFLPAVDGVVTRLCRTLEELALAGDEVMVVAPAGGPQSYCGAPVVGVPGLRVPLYPDGTGYPEKRVSLPIPPLGPALRRFAPDVIHAVNPLLLGAGAVRFADRHDIPLIASYHAHLPYYTRYYGLGALEEFGWRYVARLHNHADVNLCTSRAAIQQLRAHGIQRVALWPYGVERDRFSPRRQSEEWRVRLSGGRPHRTILLCVGRLAKEKSFHRLAPAMRQLDGVALAIAGDGPLRPELERQFAGTSTTFLGLLSNDALSRAYAAADVFVFPSDSETLGMVILEAHAAGLPVVAADTPAARELVRDRVDGLLFDVAQSRELVAAVRSLVEDRDLRRAMGEEGRRSVTDATWSRATAVLRGHYCTAARARRPSAPDGRLRTRSADGRTADVISTAR